MSARALWEGADGARWAQTVDGRTKVCLLLSFTVLMVTIDSPATLFALFTMALLMHLAAKTSFVKWEVLSALMMLCLWGSIVSQALFYAQTPRNPLVCLISPEFPIIGAFTDGVFLYREGVAYGAVQGMRSATMLCVGLFVCWSSDPRTLLNAFVAWKMPPMASFMTVTALRFLPVLAAESAEVMTAARLRKKAAGEPFRQWDWFVFLPRMIYPLLARSLRRAQTLSLSVMSRGFVHYRPQSDKKWPVCERCVAACLLLLSLAVLSMKLVYILSEQNLFYIAQGRWIYDIARVWL